MATSQGEAGGGIYSGGNALFNAQPFVQFQTNLLAREQAKNEALDNGYKDMLKGLTPAGMRSQEVAPFVDKVNGLQNFYLQNADKIKNPRLDRGAAAAEFNSRYNDALGYAQQSKNLVGVAKQTEDFRRQALLQGRSFTDQNTNDLIANEYPIGDPRHKDFDLTTINLNPKPFDLQKHLDLYKDVKPNKTTVSTITNPNNPAETIETSTGVFSPETVQGVATRAQAAYQTDPSYKTYIDNLAKDQTKYQQYNDLYKHVIGKDFDLNHPEELAFAHDLSLLQQNATTQKVLPNPVYTQQQENARQLRGFQHTDSKDAEAGLWTLKALRDLSDRAISNPDNARIYQTADGKQNSEYLLPANPLLIKSLTLGKEAPDEVYFNPTTKEYRPIIYQRDADGKIVQDATGNKAVDLDKSKGTLGEADVIDAIAGKNVGKKLLANEVQSGITKNTAPVPTHTKSEFKSAGWTDDQINKALKAGKIKIR